MEAWMVPISSIWDVVTMVPISYGGYEGKESLWNESSASRVSSLHPTPNRPIYEIPKLLWENLLKYLVG
jgi:hypothetical protein